MRGGGAVVGRARPSRSTETSAARPPRRSRRASICTPSATCSTIFRVATSSAASSPSLDELGPGRAGHDPGRGGRRSAGCARSASKLHKLGRRRRAMATARSTVTFFNQHWREKQLKPGTRVLFAGKVRGVRQASKIRSLTEPGDEPDDDDDFAGGAARALSGQREDPHLAHPQSREGAARRRCRNWPIRFRQSCAQIPAPGPSRGVPEDPPAHRLRATSRPPASGCAGTRRWSIQVALAQRRAAVERQSAVPRPVRPGGLLRGLRPHAAVHAHRGPAGGRRRARRATWPARFPMHRLLQGEVGFRQDGRRAARDAHGDRRGRPGGAAGAHRGAGRCSTSAACGHCSARSAQPVSWAAPTRRRSIVLLTGSQSAPARRASARGHRRTRDRDRRRHPRPASEGTVLRRTRAGRGGRAAPLRGRAARRPARPRRGRRGHAAAPAGHDGDADPAHGGDDGLRRPRHQRADRASRRTHPHPEPRCASASGITGSGRRCARRSRPATRRSWSARASAKDPRPISTPATSRRDDLG